jgi:hypothetical protein
MHGSDRKEKPAETAGFGRYRTRVFGGTRMPEKASPV